MEIYFACSITGGRQDEKHYQQLVNTLLLDGHKVPTAGLTTSEVIALEVNKDPTMVYLRDTNWIRDSEVLIAEISTPSHGVGYEIGYALQLHIPVICLYQKGVRISKMILGNKDVKLTIYEYQDIYDAISFIRSKLSSIQKSAVG